MSILGFDFHGLSETVAILVMALLYGLGNLLKKQVQPDKPVAPSPPEPDPAEHQPPAPAPRGRLKPPVLHPPGRTAPAPVTTTRPPQTQPPTRRVAPRGAPANRPAPQRGAPLATRAKPRTPMARQTPAAATGATAAGPGNQPKPKPSRVDRRKSSGALQAEAFLQQRYRTLGKLDPSSLRRAIILSEILSPPVSLRPSEERFMD